MDFIGELSWRGMIHDIMPGTKEQLKREMTSAYVGIDPTANSLHIGHLVSIMLLKHFQLAGHRPIVLVGGATGMIGDPSGKSQERNLLDESTLRQNQECIKKQIRKFLDFDTKLPHAAIMVNNYDWMKTYSFLDFIRDIGKHITVNYMMAKDSVKKRLDPENGTGMSFTEFSYQLVQGYDFLFLYQNHSCKLQMGGSDQWGNIVTGTELIRRKTGGEAFALTCPLITKSDGSKFGKTEEGNVWLDPQLTSPFKMYQFWLNVSDEDAEKYIRIFTLLGRKEIEELILEHRKTPEHRILQKRLAREVCSMIHSEEDYNAAVEASGILFGSTTFEAMTLLSEEILLAVFEGVPSYQVHAGVMDTPVADLLAVHTNIFSSKGEFRRMVEGGGLFINKNKITDTGKVLSANDLIRNKYLLIQKGKKNHYLIIINN
jgi:tyrosyl-tRNA synthetase